MELIHFLSAGPHVINYAPGMLRKNLKDIEDLIINKQLISLPPRSKKLQLYLNSDRAYISEGYPFKGDYENDKFNSIKFFDFMQQSYIRYYYLSSYLIFCVSFF
jgi:hypothetical protein